MNRYERALQRNLNEIGFAIFEGRAIKGMENADSDHIGIDFFRLSFFALFNDMIAHTIKVLDRDSKSASFWYIYRCENCEVKSYAGNLGYDLTSLEALADALKSIRDETHFHIDRNAVFDPRKVWLSAGITGEQLDQALDTIFNILQHLHKKRFGKKFPLPDYDGTDATKIIKAAQDAKIIPD